MKCETVQNHIRKARMSLSNRRTPGRGLFGTKFGQPNGHQLASGLTLDINSCLFLKNVVLSSDVVFNPSLSDGDGLVPITFYNVLVTLCNSQFSQERSPLDPSLSAVDCIWEVEGVPS
jgi:hypothetical protein